MKTLKETQKIVKSFIKKRNKFTVYDVNFLLDTLIK